jgi:hypothetical protein
LTVERAAGSGRAAADQEQPPADPLLDYEARPAEESDLQLCDEPPVQETECWVYKTAKPAGWCRCLVGETVGEEGVGKGVLVAHQVENKRTDGFSRTISRAHWTHFHPGRLDDDGNVPQDGITLNPELVIMYRAAFTVGDTGEGIVATNVEVKCLPAIFELRQGGNKVIRVMRFLDATKKSLKLGTESADNLSRQPHQFEQGFVRDPDDPNEDVECLRRVQSMPAAGRGDDMEEEHEAMDVDVGMITVYIVRKSGKGYGVVERQVHGAEFMAQKPERTFEDQCEWAIRNPTNHEIDPSRFKSRQALNDAPPIAVPLQHAPHRHTLLDSPVDLFPDSQESGEINASVMVADLGEKVHFRQSQQMGLLQRTVVARPALHEQFKEGSVLDFKHSSDLGNVKLAVESSTVKAVTQEYIIRAFDFDLAKAMELHFTMANAHAVRLYCKLWLELHPDEDVDGECNENGEDKEDQAVWDAVHEFREWMRGEDFCKENIGVSAGNYFSSWVNMQMGFEGVRNLNPDQAQVKGPGRQRHPHPSQMPVRPHKL